MNKINFKIKGMSCNSCVQLITQELKKQPGVIEAKVDLSSKTCLVMYDKTKIQKQGIFDAVKKAGDYQAQEIGDGENQSEAGGRRNKEVATKEKKNSVSPLVESQNNAMSASSKPFLKGLLAGGGVVFLLLNILFSVSYKQPSLQAKIDPAGNTENNGLPEKQKQAQNVAVNPAQDIQTFVITKNDHIRGNPNASITLVEFSDFECPFCERQYNTLNQLLKEYPKEIRLVYKHFPLGFHQYAQKAAEASECASEQDSFWEYHDKLFENQNSYSVENFKKWAKGLGLDANQFNSCLDSGKYAQKVQDDAKEGQQVGVNGTPATFINGQLISGALPYATFKEAIDSLL